MKNLKMIEKPFVLLFLLCLLPLGVSAQNPIISGQYSVAPLRLHASEWPLSDYRTSIIMNSLCTTFSIK